MVETVIQRTKLLLKEKGLKQKYLFEQIGKSPVLFNDWKNGKSKPTDEVLKNIADVLDTTPEYLLGETDECRADQPQEFAEQEKALLSMFRRTSEEGRLRMIQAVMNIYDECETRVIYRAARSDTDTPPTIETRSIADLNKLKNAKKITSDEDL